MSTSPNPPSAELASALAAELRTLLGKFKRKLRDHAGHEEITVSQISVLVHLEKDGPATASSLARAESMRPQSMSAVLAPLEAAGLVQGTPDPNDGRQTLFSLTSKCRDLIQERRAAKQDWLTRTILAKLSLQEQEQLAIALKALARLVED